jgi:hypothetical protein
MTGLEVLNNVHYGLGQDPASSTNYVSDTEIAAFANQAVYVLAYVGKFYPCVLSQALTSERGLYGFPNTGTPTNDIDGAIVGAAAFDIYDIQWMGTTNDIHMTGQSLKKLEGAIAGQTFYVQNNTEPIFYTVIGNTYTLYPSPKFDVQAYINVYHYAIPPTITALAAGTNLYLCPEQHPAIVTYALAKGKQKYQLYTHSQALLQEFVTMSGFNADQAKSVGVK